MNELILSLIMLSAITILAVVGVYISIKKMQRSPKYAALLALSIVILATISSLVVFAVYVI